MGLHRVYALGAPCAPKHNHTQGDMPTIYTCDWYKCVSSGRTVSRLRVEPWNYPPIPESCYNYSSTSRPVGVTLPLSLFYLMLDRTASVCHALNIIAMTLHRGETSRSSALLIFIYISLLTKIRERARDSSWFSFIYSLLFISVISKTRFEDHWYYSPIIRTNKPQMQIVELWNYISIWYAIIKRCYMTFCDFLSWWSYYRDHSWYYIEVIYFLRVDIFRSIAIIYSLFEVHELKVIDT